MLLYHVGDSNAQRLVRGFHVSATVRRPGNELRTRIPVALKYACCLALAKDRRCAYFARERPGATIKHTAGIGLHQVFVKSCSSTFFAVSCIFLLIRWNRERPRVEPSEKAASNVAASSP